MDDHVDELVDDSLFPVERQPEWAIDIGQGCAVGAQIDDGCFVVLTQDQWGYWTPTTHVPVEAVGALADLASRALATADYRGAGSASEYRSPHPDGLAGPRD